MKRLLICLIVLMVSDLKAQTSFTDVGSFSKSTHTGLFKRKNPRKLNPLGVGFTYLGPTELLSLEVDYFIIPQVNLMVGTWFDEVYVGAKYHHKGNTGKRITKFIGLYALSDYSFVKQQNYSPLNVYIPIGLQYLSKKGRTISLEAGIIVNKTELTPKLGINLAYHFRPWPKNK